MRLPISLAAGWIGGVIGARQAKFMTRALTSSLEDPRLQEVYETYHSHSTC
jgi:hypothetical protein